MELNLPDYKPEAEKRKDKVYIKCLVRGRWLVLTPEEWVRQHLINWFISQFQFSKNRMAVEKGLDYNGRKKRFDILVYDKNLQPFLMVECKAPQIKMEQSVLEQIAVYNSILKVPYLLISNGMTHYLFKLEGVKYVFCDQGCEGEFGGSLGE